MLDHVILKTSDLPRSIKFYDAALAPFGITRLHGDAQTFAGYGNAQKTFFWIGASATPITGTHIALTAGGTDNAPRPAPALTRQPLRRLHPGPRRGPT